MKKQLFYLLTIALFVQNYAFAQDSEYVLKFDAATETQSIKYSDDATTSALDGATDYTIELWVNPNDNSSSGDVWLTMRNTFRVTFWSNNRFYFTHKTPDGSGGSINAFFNSANDAITLNEWNHIAVICDSSDGSNGSVKLYVNGVDVTEQSYDALSIVGGETNNDIFVSYGGVSYSNMYAREVRIKKTSEAIGDLNTNIADPNYTTDSDTTVLFHFAEGTGLTTVNSASGVDAVFGYNDAHYPTWVLLADTLGNSEHNTIDFSIFPNPTKNQFTVQAGTNESIQTVEVVSLLGQTVRSLQFDTQINSVNVNIEGLTTGQYFVTTKTNIGIGTQKLIIN